MGSFRNHTIVLKYDKEEGEVKKFSLVKFDTFQILLNEPFETLNI